MDRQPSELNADGVWDLGAKVSKPSDFPISAAWRIAGKNKFVVHSTWVPRLLMQYSNE